MYDSDGSIDSWLDPSLDDDCSNDSWLYDGSDTENHYEYTPIPVPSPIRRKSPRTERDSQREGAGPRPLHEKFPQIIDTATEFITQQSYAADARRRTSVGRACGTSLASLKRHLENEVPNLSISRSTCARLMVPPNKRRASSKDYKGLIQAKVPAKKNDERAHHVDSHYCSARVKYRLEFAAEFSSEVAVLSCDCMNKLHVGGMAVSRYHQIRRYHMLDDAPNYPDHDFPQGSGYLITPCGYMLLSKKDDIPSHVPDEFGRIHLHTPRTGPVYIVNRSQKFHKMTIQEHTNDLIPLLRDCTDKGETGVVLVVDGGPDWSESSWSVMLYLSRLLQRLDLDFLCMTKYSPKNSAFNPIEHSWAPLSRMLTSVRLRSTLEGETQPPSSQSDLTQQQKEDKEATLFDRAMEEVNSFWDGQTYDGHPIVSTHHPCKSPSTPYNDYDKVHPIISGSKTKLLQSPELHKEMIFAINHVHKRPRELCFMKCERRDCDFCSAHPVRAVAAMEQVRNGRGPLLVPQETTNHPVGHYKTYLNLSKAADVDETDRMPSSVEKNLGKCPFCTCYIFSSKQDKKKHLNIFHQ